MTYHFTIQANTTIASFHADLPEGDDEVTPQYVADLVTELLNEMPTDDGEALVEPRDVSEMLSDDGIECSGVAVMASEGDPSQEWKRVA